MVEATAGLGVFVQEEVARRDLGIGVAEGTVSAAIAAGGKEGPMDSDPF